MTKRSTFFPSLLILLSLLLAACGVDSKHFKVEGRLLNMNMGEFYIYSVDGVISGIDTIKVEGGRFAYEIHCEHPSTLMLVFPNFSQQPIFASPGKTASIDGDASHLKMMKVKGTKDNELMTKFREQTVNASPVEIQKYAATFVEDHPASPVGVFLVAHYFINNTQRQDFREADRLLALMAPKQPNNGMLARLSQQVKALKATTQGATLPTFTDYDIHGRLVSSSSLSSGIAVIFTYASWSFESMDQLRRLKNLTSTANGRLKVVGLCVDASKVDCRNTLRADSASWPVVCDEQMLDGRTVRALGLLAVPDNLVLQNGRVVAHGLSTNDLESKLKELL